MPLDQLLAALEREAGEAADRLVAHARTEAAALTAATAQDAAVRRDRLVAAEVAALRQAADRAVSEAGWRSRRDRLEARERLLARVLEAVRASLPAATAEPAYQASIPQRLAGALACVDEHEPVILRCQPSLLVAVQGAISARPGLVVQADDAVGSGFRLTTADGAVEVDDTLEARLVGARIALARHALQQLEVDP